MSCIALSMTRSIVTASVIDMKNEELTLHLLRIRFAGVVSVNLCLRWIPVYRHETMKNVITSCIVRLPSVVWEVIYERNVQEFLLKAIREQE